MASSIKKILVTEDEKPMAKALALKLNHEGFEAQEAHNGEEALDLLAKEKFDLMLLDLMMPRMDGFSVLEKIKEAGYTTKVIVTSNLSQEEDRKRAKDLGAIDYFVKSDTPLNKIVEYIKNL